MARRATFVDGEPPTSAPSKAPRVASNVHKPSALLTGIATSDSLMMFIQIAVAVMVVGLTAQFALRWLVKARRKRSVELKVEAPPVWEHGVHAGGSDTTFGFFVGNHVSFSVVSKGLRPNEAVVLSRFSEKVNNSTDKSGFEEVERQAVTREEVSLSFGPLMFVGRYRLQYIRKDEKKPIEDVFKTVFIEVQAPKVSITAESLMWKDAVPVTIATSSSRPSGDSLVLVAHTGAASEPLVDRYVGKLSEEVCGSPVSTLRVPNVTTPASPITAALTGPSRPGTYVVLYTSGLTKQVLAVSDAVTVTGPALRHVKPQAAATDSSMFWNESLLVHVAANSAHSGDTLVLRKEGDAGYGEVALAIPDLTPCTVVFANKQAPRLPGRYFVHYVSARESLATLGPILVRGPVLHAAHPADYVDTSPAWNDPVSVNIEASDKRSPTDVIVLTRVGELPFTTARSAVAKPVSHQMRVPEPTLRTVVCTFSDRDAPGFPGLYQFQYYCDRGGPIGKPDAVSEVFAVRGPTLKVSDQGKFWREAIGVTFGAGTLHDERDFIALAKSGEPAMMASGFFGASGVVVPVPRGPSGTVYFEGKNAPPLPGKYQFAYFGVTADNPTLLGGAKPEEIARSDEFEILGPSLWCSLADKDEIVPTDSFLVSRSITEVTPARVLLGYSSSFNHDERDWVGVARVGGVPNVGETSRCWYTIPKTQRGVVTFEPSALPNQRGEFEFCYVEYGSGAVIGRGGRFMIDVGPKREVTARVVPAEPVAPVYQPTAPPLESDHSVVAAAGSSTVPTPSIPSAPTVVVGVPFAPDEQPAPAKPTARPVFEVATMKHDSISPQILPKQVPLIPEAVTPLPPSAVSEPSAVPAKFQQMLKAQVPADAIRQRMIADGIAGDVIDGFLGVAAPAPAPAPVVASPVVSEPTVVDPPAAAAGSDSDVPFKYHQMKKMNMPDPVIRQRMALDGMAQSLIDGFLGPSDVPASPASISLPAKPRPPAPPAAAAQKPSPAVSSKPAAVDAKPTGPPKPVMTLPPLSPAQVMDINMCLSTFRAVQPPSKFREAIATLDESLLNGEEGIELLMKHCIGGDAAKPYQAFAGDVGKLSPPEMFVLTLARIPRCARKLRALKFVWQWQQELKGVTDQAALLQQACDTVLAWNELKTIARKHSDVSGGSLPSPSTPLVPLTRLDTWSRKAKDGDGNVADVVASAVVAESIEWKPATAPVRKSVTIVPTALTASLKQLQMDSNTARDEARACSGDEGASSWSGFASTVLAACGACDVAAAAASKTLLTVQEHVSVVSAQLGQSGGAGDSASANPFAAIRAFSDMFDKAMEKARRMAGRAPTAATGAASSKSTTPVSGKTPVAPAAPRPSLQDMLNAKFSGAQARGLVDDGDTSSDEDFD